MPDPINSYLLESIGSIKVESRSLKEEIVKLKSEVAELKDKNRKHAEETKAYQSMALDVLLSRRENIVEDGTVFLSQFVELITSIIIRVGSNRKKIVQLNHRLVLIKCQVIV